MDEDKLTFIILARTDGGTCWHKFCSISYLLLIDQLSPATSGVSPADSKIQALPMVGDVNVFLNGNPNEPDDFTAELEVMIAGTYALQPSLRLLF